MESITKETLEQFTLFQGLQPTTYTSLLSKAHLERYKNGTHLFLEKDTLCCFYIVLSGTVSIYKTNSNGQNKVIFILGKGALLNEVIFEDLAASVNCKVHEDCDILMIYRTDFLPLMQKDFRLTQNVMNQLTNRVRRLYRQVKNATSVIKIEKKLAAKLWKLSLDYGKEHEQGILINFPITVTSLAELLGSYRETISRALKILVGKELIIYENKRIIIPDPDALSRFFKAP